jgi:hypothetical protein
MYSKRLFQLNNRTQKRYKQIKTIYLQKTYRRVYLQDTFLTQATINLNK